MDNDDRALLTSFGYSGMAYADKLDASPTVMFETVDLVSQSDNVCLEDLQRTRRYTILCRSAALYERLGRELELRTDSPSSWLVRDSAGIREPVA